MKAKYYCETCGAAYDTEAEALACEKSHEDTASVQHRSDCLEDMRDAIDSYFESALEDNLNFFDCMDVLHHTLEDGFDTYKEKFINKMDTMSGEDIWAYLEKGLRGALGMDSHEDKKSKVNLKDALKPVTLKFKDVKIHPELEKILTDAKAKKDVIDTIKANHPNAHGHFERHEYDEFGNLVDEIIKDF